MVPVFLASSFAFIAPITYGVNHWGIAGTMSGLMAAGILYVILGLLIKLRGTGFIEKLLPPIVTGPVIMVIGLVLAPVAVNMAMGKSGDGTAVLVAENKAMIVSMLSLAVTVLVSVMGKGILKLIPILAGITVGYIASLFAGVIDFTAVNNAPWFAIPKFTFPQWNWEAVLFITPIAIAPAIEHFGDILAIGTITGKNYLKEPGLHRTMIGDGIATSLASFLGGPPNTTYSEVTGAVALTRSFNPGIMTWAAITAVLLAFVGKVGAFLRTIPVPVMGGIMILLFGTITVVGLNTLVKAGQDLMESRNMAIVALILVFGIGGMSVGYGEFTLKGIGLAGLLGVILNQILPHDKSQKKTN
jgi:uracil permease